jgi:hypothetical protein
MPGRFDPAGAPMRLLFALFLLAVSAAAFAEYGVEMWDGRLGHADPAMRTITYSSNYEVTGQRRVRPAPNPQIGERSP